MNTNETSLLTLSFCCVSGFFIKSKLILMARSLGTKAIAVTQVHCIYSADSDVPDQTAQKRSLIRAFAVRIWNQDSCSMTWFILYVYIPNYHQHTAWNPKDHLVLECIFQQHRYIWQCQTQHRLLPELDSVGVNKKKKKKKKKKKL